MAAEQIAFRITYASVWTADGADPSAKAERILRDARILAAVRGFDGESTTLLLPVTGDGSVVALDADDGLRFDLSADDLGRLFAASGLSLNLGLTDDALGEVDAELEQQFGEAFEQLDGVDDEDDLTGAGMPDEDLLAPDPVRVTEFSRRGPWAARMTAQLLDTPVDYLEDGTWSVFCYHTDRAHGAVSGGASDLPVIEVNVPHDGEAWVEVTGPHGRSAMFWPNAEQFTRPVLPLDSITRPASVEVYRRMLSEVDGAREELAQLGMGDVDADAVLRACLPEALGGVEGSHARLRALVVAFGMPDSLVSAGLDETGGGRRFFPQGWPRTVSDIMVGGIVEATSLVHRDRPVVRFARFLRKRPVLNAALSTAELAAGVSLSWGRSRVGRGIGILLVLDAAADLALWIVRIRRR